MSFSPYKLSIIRKHTPSTIQHLFGTKNKKKHSDDCHTKLRGNITSSESLFDRNYRQIVFRELI